MTQNANVFGVSLQKDILQMRQKANIARLTRDVMKKESLKSLDLIFH